MAIDNLQVLDIIEEMEGFLERKRPPENMRHQVDLGYKIEDQSIIVHEIRPLWEDSAKIIYPELAKATFVKTEDHWRIFWMREKKEWAPYDPLPIVKTVWEFV